MEYLNNWIKFNENNNSDKNQILIEIIEKLNSKIGSLIDLDFGNIMMSPYVYFVSTFIEGGFCGFTISIQDKIGISVIVEVEGVTDSLGYFNINEIDRVVDSISNYLTFRRARLY